MILELSDLLALAGMMTPAYGLCFLIVIKQTRLEQHCKEKTGYCDGENHV